MAYDPADLLRLAEQLLAGQDEDETNSRTAINRSYYACHLAARDRLYGLDAQRYGPRRPSHTAVLAAVGRQLPAERGDELRRLKRMREVADYVRDSEHRDVQLVFGREGVSGWTDLGDVAFTVAHDLLPLLQTMQPAPYR